MPCNRPIHWKIDPGHVQLMHFLIEKTRDATSPVSFYQLAEEFKMNSGDPHGFSTLRTRIAKFRGRIREMDWIDTAAKVRMMVALSASVVKDFLNELRKDADVEVDWKNRIIKYRAKDGSLVLEADHSQSAKVMYSWIQRDMNSGFMDITPRIPGSMKRVAAEVPESAKEDYDPDDFYYYFIPPKGVERTRIKEPDTTPQTPRSIERVAGEETNYVKSLDELKEFLIEKTRDATSSMNINQLAQEFKDHSGTSEYIKTLCSRITKFRGRIHELESIDTVAKVRMLVALGASTDENFLNELRKDADVEVDWKNRIIKYRATDGSLELEGDHSQSAKVKDSWKQRRMGSGFMDIFMDITPRTSGSMKGVAAEVPESAKEDYDPDDFYYYFIPPKGVKRAKIKKPVPKDKNIPVEKLATTSGFN